MMKAESEERFVHPSWEDIYVRLAESEGLSGLRRFLETKTAGLRPAFSLAELRLD